jgi:hypothetical protein
MPSRSDSNWILAVPDNALFARMSRFCAQLPNKKTGQAKTPPGMPGGVLLLQGLVINRQSARH